MGYPGVSKIHQICMYRTIPEKAISSIFAAPYTSYQSSLPWSPILKSISGYHFIMFFVFSCFSSHNNKNFEFMWTEMKSQTMINTEVL